MYVVGLKVQDNKTTCASAHCFVFDWVGDRKFWSLNIVVYPFVLAFKSMFS